MYICTIPCDDTLRLLSEVDQSIKTLVTNKLSLKSINSKLLASYTMYHKQKVMTIGNND